MDCLHTLATHFRAMQLFAHMAHNKVSGPTFFEDHEFLGELYGTYETNYDSVVERMIGLGGTPDIMEITNEANEYLQKMTCGENVQDYLSCLLHCEKRVCEEIEPAAVGDEYTQATINLLVQIGDDSEKRQYQIQQRIGRLIVDEKPGDALDRLAKEKMKEHEEEEEGY